MGEATLHRTTFETHRALEFFTERELTMQLGFPRRHWVLAILKELIDNALDACESAGVVPAIAVTRTRNTLSVQDNGPGLPQATLERSLDYMVRVSDKAYYASPSRGQLGNALKCLWAMPYVLHKDFGIQGGTEGRIEIATPGMRYDVRGTLDPFLQQPSITLTSEADATIKNGTRVTLHIACCLMGFADADFYHPVRLLQGYALFNPHASFVYCGPDATDDMYMREYGEQDDFPCITMSLPASTQGWPKWVPSWPTSAHWYTPQRFAQLIGAYLAADRRTGRVRTVRDFIGEFDGLTGVQVRKDVGVKAQLHGATLEDLVRNATLDMPKVRALLAAMQARAREVKPQALGVLGEEHIRHALMTTYGVEGSTITYKRDKGVWDGVPYVVEVAVGWSSNGRPGSRLYGYKSAPSLHTPFPCLHHLVQKTRMADGDVASLVVHLMCPRLDATDRGKTSVSLPDGMEQALAHTVRLAAKAWEKLKREDERHDRQGQRLRDAALRAHRREQYTIKEAAWEVMEQAYRKASDNGRLPANARQIMYAARPDIIRLTGKADALADSAYFTQHLLPDFIEAYPERTARWDVAYDARGHFREPHTEKEFGVGTLEVRRYIHHWRDAISTDVHPRLDADISTYGPAHRYAYALFIEKEGFNELLRRANIANRYDLALMSTKGMSVTAARQLVESLSGAGVTLLVVHDFDKSGMEILHTLFANTRRYTYTITPKVMDLGLRLGQAQAMGLESESVIYSSSNINPCESLRSCGATDEECDFLVQGRSPLTRQWHGKRIELNAMTSQQFLDWLEHSLREAGVTKVVPDEPTLAKAYQHQKRVAALQDIIAKAIQEYDAQELGALVIPADLAQRIRERITDSARSWDEGLWQIIGDDEGSAPHEKTPAQDDGSDEETRRHA